MSLHSMYFFISTDLCNIFLNEGHPAHKGLVLGIWYQCCYRQYLEDADYLSSLHWDKTVSVVRLWVSEMVFTFSEMDSQACGWSVDSHVDLFTNLAIL